MLANNMRQGQTGKLVNGNLFMIMDNMGRFPDSGSSHSHWLWDLENQGNIRLAKVYGISDYDKDVCWTEIGSIYVHDIETVDMPDGSLERIELTPAQTKKAVQTFNLQRATIGRTK